MQSFGKFDEYVSLAAKDTDKAAEIVARSFYKILRKNGFDDSQIIGVANSLLDCLINAFEGYRKKTEQKEIATDEVKMVKNLSHK